MSFAKRGGFLAEVDEAIFVEVRANKRTLHFKSTKLPARSLHDVEPSKPVADFNLQEHIDMIAESSSQVDEFSL